MKQAKKEPKLYKTDKDKQELTRNTNKQLCGLENDCIRNTNINIPFVSAP